VALTIGDVRFLSDVDMRPATRPAASKVPSHNDQSVILRQKGDLKPAPLGQVGLDRTT
jgi:hypothetical protein